MAILIATRGELSAWLAYASYAACKADSGFGGDIDAMAVPLLFWILWDGPL